MNFLAHLLLAPPTPHGMVGCLLPDLVHGPIPVGLHPAVLSAAAEHQSIDRFTDRHRAFLNLRNRLRESCDRYAGVAADILFDHALASRWADYHRDPLATYITQVGQSLDKHRQLMPPTMQPIADRMIEQDWLSTYPTRDGMHLTLSRVSRRITQRLGRPVDLTPAADTLADPQQYTALLADFAAIWPDLVDHVDTHRHQHRPPRRAAS